MKTLPSAALFLSAALLFLITSAPTADAQIDRNLVQKALAEAEKSDPETRKTVLGTLAVYDDLPKAVKGGEAVPAEAGHPFSASPLVTDGVRESSKDVVIPLMTIFRGADHGDAGAIVKSAEMFDNHMKNLPVPGHLNEKLGHIKKCPACAAHVSHMIYQHEEAVAHAPAREIVLFPTGQAELTFDARDRVHDFARTVAKHPDSRICLIGRASRIGGWQYNRVLSERRTDAVAGGLRLNGVAAEKITTLWLGFDEPQLNHRAAIKYGLDDLFHRAGRQLMNQSVLMVMYFESPPVATITSDPNIVISPHPPHSKIDVSGFQSGVTATDPVSRKPFVIP